MGGGGGGPGHIGDVKSLIEKAKKELKAGEATGRRNVFLSFDYRDLNYVNLLRGQARNENIPLEFNDWSVTEAIDSDRAAYIKQKISDRITQSSVTVVFLSENTLESRWVDWEIRESLKLGKRVIGVHPSGASPQLPQAFREFKVRVVPWPQLATAVNSE